MMELEEKLGYAFKDPSLLSEALNHSSYANEHRAQGENSNERLEFLGDSVLVFVTAELLFELHQDLPEGDLTRQRAALVCEQSLHEVAKMLDLGKYLKLGKGEESGGGRHRASIRAASDLIHRVLLDKEGEHAESLVQDYKTALQELVQRKSGQQLSYHMVGESGPDHNKTFTAEVLLNGEGVGTGSGHSKKEAEQAAARAAIRKLEC